MGGRIAVMLAIFIILFKHGGSSEFCHGGNCYVLAAHSLSDAINVHDISKIKSAVLNLYIDVVLTIINASDQGTLHFGLAYNSITSS